MYLPVGHRIKSTKQVKNTLKNRAVSLKHIPVTSAKQVTYPQTIESNVHMIIITGLYLREG